MNFNKILQELFEKVRNGIKPGLERTIELANYLENPQNNYKVIHIAGTNGKGTVSNMIASVLMESGYKVGLYNSPHLVNFNERIQINGKKITNSDIIKIYKKVRNKANDLNATFFEITTVMAFYYFAYKKVDIAVIETGMGGRYDSTNICSPILSIITSISYDHMQFLGNTLDEIAYEKAGIIKDNIPVVIQDNLNNVTNILVNVAKSKKSKIYFSKDIDLNIKKYSKQLYMELIWQEYDAINLKIPFIGTHYLDNLKTVLASLSILSKDLNLIDINAIKIGLKKSKKNFNLRGRLDFLDRDKNIILSGAHNEDSIDKDLNALCLCGFKLEDLDFYFTCMKDKNIPNIIKVLEKYIKNIIFVDLDNERAIKSKEFKSFINRSSVEIERIINIFDLIVELKKYKQKLFIGSFYLIGEVIKSYNLIKKNKFNLK
jgi:dihydrofolate synthase/folylpolyglutamate synthase